jgi:hypothetical protein
MANAAVATFPGRAILWNRVRGNGTEPKNLQWGDSTVTGSASPNVNLFKPQTEARTVGTSTIATTSFLGDTYSVSGSIVCAVGAKTITEVGLFDTTTQSPTTTVSASMTAAQTTVSLGAAVAGTPTTGRYYRQIENETVLVTAGQSTTTETIVRGRLGSTSAVHSSGVATAIGDDGGTATGGGTTEQTATVGAAAGGAIFIHADFAGISLSVSDSINFSVLDQLS